MSPSPRVIQVVFVIIAALYLISVLLPLPGMAGRCCARMGTCPAPQAYLAIHSSTELAMKRTFSNIRKMVEFERKRPNKTANNTVSKRILRNDPELGLVFKTILRREYVK